MQDIVEMKDRCVFCRKREATKLCDFPTGYIWSYSDNEAKAETCDRQMCDKCATELATEFHFCPRCVETAKVKLGLKKK